MCSLTQTNEKIEDDQDVVDRANLCIPASEFILFGISYCSVSGCVLLQRTQSMLCHAKNSGFVWVHG